MTTTSPSARHSTAPRMRTPRGARARSSHAAKPIASPSSDPGVSHSDGLPGMNSAEEAIVFSARAAAVSAMSATAAPRNDRAIAVSRKATPAKLSAATLASR